MLNTIISFLVMLNPFAMFLYLVPLAKKLEHKSFTKVLMKASLISFFIFLLFVFVGEFIFEKILRIDFESFRIFGGIIILSYAYMFLIKGKKSMIKLKGDIDDIAQEIALPFMVGAGTISLSILMPKQISLIAIPFVLLLVLILNYLLIMTFKTIRDNLKNKNLRLVFDKNLEIFLRLNGFFVGAIGLNIILTGINNLYL